MIKWYRNDFAEQSGHIYILDLYVPTDTNGLSTLWQSCYKRVMKWLFECRIKLKGGERELDREGLRAWISEKSTWTGIVSLLGMLGFGSVSNVIGEVGFAVVVTAIQIYNIIRREK